MRFVTSLLVMLLSAGLSACQKDESSPRKNTPASAEAEEASQSLLVGRWELVASSGGIAGGRRPADPARRQEIVFRPAGQAQLLLNGTVTNTISYALNTAPVITGGNGVFITFAPRAEFSGSAIYQLTSTDLVLSQNMYDGFSFHFVRR